MTALAASTYDDGLNVEIITDEIIYDATATADVTIRVTNYNDFAVGNVSVESILPDKLELAETTELSTAITSLAAGESIEMQLKVKDAFIEDSKIENNEQNDTTVFSKSSTSSNEAVTSAESAKMGDSSKILIYAIVAVLSLALVVVIVTKTKNKKAIRRLLSILLCVGMVASSFPNIQHVMAATNIDKKDLSLSETVTFGENSYDISIKVNYNYEGINDGVSYTKGEWIQLLAEKLEFDLNIEADDIDYFYADTMNSEYGIAIETAQAYGILPKPDSEGYVDPEQDVPLFNADEIVTREFATYTIVKAMGFYGKYPLSCQDLDSLDYPSEDAVAVKIGIIDLVNNCFMPDTAMSTSDKNRIFATINMLNGSTKIKDSFDSVVYKDGVIVIEDLTDYTVSYNDDNTINVELPKNDVTGTIGAGNIFVLPANDDNISSIGLKAINVTENSNGKLTILCTKPELEEVLTDIKYSGNGEAALDKMKVADGVTCEYDASGSIGDEENKDAYPLQINGGGSIAVPGKLTFTVNEKKLSDNVTASGKIEVTIPDITCKVDAEVGALSGVNLNELVVSMSEEFKLIGEIKYKQNNDDELIDVTHSNGWEGGSLELTRIPIKLGASGLSLDIVFFYTVSVEGTVSITYTIEATQGLQVINGAVRNLSSFQKSLEDISIKGSAKTGPKVALRLNALSLIDLIGVDAQLGVGIAASFILHTSQPPLYCADASLFYYLTLELDTDTALGEFIKNKFDAECSWDIFNEDNGKFKSLHIENGSVVDECTYKSMYGTGSISGYVAREDNNGIIYKARVKIYSGNKLEKTLYTDVNGEYKISNLAEGEYTMKISATGYYTYTVDVKVERNETAYMETLLMVDRYGTSSEGSVCGKITDAVTGSSVRSVTYNVRKGWSNSTSPIIETGIISEDNYLIDLEVGNYTIEFVKDGYVSNSVNIAVGASDTTTKHVALSPESASLTGSSMRVVLTWGLNPSDLDSHMFGPNVNGTSTFHTYFMNKNYGEDGNTIANLDLDDITSYGPETTTVYSLNDSGSYSFFVHDYSNRIESDSTKMSTSGAQVKVYSGNNLIATYNVPTNVGGTLWHVFDYNSDTDAIKAVNILSYSSEPSLSD